MSLTSREIEFLIAAELGRVDLLACLLSADVRQVDVNCLNAYALTLAAANGHNDALRLLVNAGADVENLGADAVRAAARSGHFHTARLLIELGADMDAIQNKALRCALAEFV